MYPLSAKEIQTKDESPKKNEEEKETNTMGVEEKKNKEPSGEMEMFFF